MLALLHRQSISAASKAAAGARARQASPRIINAAIVPHRAFLASSAARYAANPQSGKPASDSWSHMAKNVKEEAGSVASSVGKSISGIDGSKGTSDQDPKQTSEIFSDAVSELMPSSTPDLSLLYLDQKTIIDEVAKKVPQPALIWGASGVIPYISTAGASVYLARQAQLVAMGLDSHIDFETASALLLHAQNIQVQFGAVLLSFLGAIHWGFEFSKFGGEIGNRRYVLGLIPIVCAWPTLLLDPQLALVGQFAAYVVAWFIDLRATTAGWAPSWYASYRFGLTTAVGLSIIATLAGTNYYDSNKSRSSRYGAGTKLAQQNEEDAPRRLELMQANASGNKGTFAETQKVGGDVESEQAGDDADGFVQIRNPKRIEEEKKKKEKEEKEKKEKEAKEKKEKEEKEKKEKEEGDKKGEDDDAEGEDEGEGEDKGDNGKDKDK